MDQIVVSQRTTTEPPKRQSLLLLSLKDERLARKVTLVFGFMAFIPLLLIVTAFFTFIFPNVQGSLEDMLRVLLIGIILSIFIGYFVLKKTMASVMDVVAQARKVTPQAGSPVNGAGGDEIVELARTFNRITQELQNKIEELETSRALIKRLLSRIGTAIVSYQGIDNVFELIVENAAGALGAQLGSLMLVDGERKELEVKTTWSTQGLVLASPRMKLNNGLVGLVIKEKRPLRGAGPSVVVGLLNADQAKDGAALCVPLTIQERTLGALVVYRTNPAHVFTEDDEVVLANIGSQVAVAIENYRLNLDVERTYLETILALALAVEAKDPYSAGHSKRVGYYAVKIAEKMGVEEETKKILNEAGLLHDVGKIGIKDEVLQKADRLTPEEEEIMRQHPVIGAAILKPLRSLTKVAELVHHHHEAYNGFGYPSGLKGDAIPLAVRILTVADTYDAMITDRPYRKRLTLEEAMGELRRQAGTQFDPNVVEAFLKFLAEKEARLSHQPS